MDTFDLDLFLTDLFPDFPRLKLLLEQELTLNHALVAERTATGGYQVTEKSSYVFTGLRKHKIIKGYVQSKKTWAIISIVLYYLFRYQKSSFIVVRNNLDDWEQLRDRLEGVLRSLSQMSTVKGTPSQTNTQYVRYLSIKRGNQATLAELQEALSESPRVYVCMRNGHDLRPVNYALSTLQGPFALIIDEIDDIDNGRDALSQQEMDRFKLRASSVWGVTATPLTSLMKEEITPSSVFLMSKPVGYKDISTFIFRELSKPARYSARVSDDLLVNDENLKDYLQDFAQTEPPFCKIYNQQHPRIALVRAGAAVFPQLQLAAYIHREYDNAITVLTYNGSAYGITLRGKGVPISEPLEAGGTLSQVNDGVHHFSGKHISVILGLLERQGIEKHPRIIILAGKKADRGISFVSSSFATSFGRSFGDTQDRLKWHLTELYMIASMSTPQGNLLQIAGRLCGVFSDSIPLTIFSNVGEHILKAYYVQDELIERGVQWLPPADTPTVSTMKEVIPTLAIAQEKCLSRRITSIGVHCPLNRVEDDISFGGFDWASEGKICQVVAADFKQGFRSNEEHIPYTPEVIADLREINQEMRKLQAHIQSTMQSSVAGRNTPKDISDTARLIMLEQIGARTILRKVYDAALEGVLQLVGTHKWIERSRITQYILSINASWVLNEQQIKGHLKNLYQNKGLFSTGPLQTETQNGLWMKKEDGEVYLRVI